MSFFFFFLQLKLKQWCGKDLNFILKCGKWFIVQLRLKKISPYLQLLKPTAGIVVMLCLGSGARLRQSQHQGRWTFNNNENY